MGWIKKNSSALAAYFLVHFKVVAARLSRFPTDAAICSHAAPGHIFDRLKVRAFKGSVQRSNAKVRFKVPCEQSETIERFRVNKVAGQMFEPVENSAASRPLVFYLFRLNRFESYHKFTQEKKWLTYTLSGSAWNIAHCPIGQLSWRRQWNFRPVNFAPNRYEKSFKMA